VTPKAACVGDLGRTLGEAGVAGEVDPQLLGRDHLVLHVVDRACVHVAVDAVDARMGGRRPRLVVGGHLVAVAAEGRLLGGLEGGYGGRRDAGEGQQHGEGKDRMREDLRGESHGVDTPLRVAVMSTAIIGGDHERHMRWV
jgi:hypothetical protein